MDFINYHFNIEAIILLSSIGLLVLIEAIYYMVVFSKVAFYNEIPKKERNLNSLPSVSVVIVAKNDRYNLEKILPIILEQEYPNFEVVVVNDSSKDKSEAVLRVFQEVYPHLNVVNLYDNVNKFLGKKYPLSLGIKTAKNDLILLIEPSSRPSSYKWISSMVRGYEGKRKQIILGFTKNETKKGFISWLISYDNLTSALNYLGNALISNPYTGYGTNLAYSRDLFFKNNGFIWQYTIPVGEDEIFVNKLANSNNCSVIIDKDAINIKNYEEGLSQMILNKKKHYVCLSYFKFKDKFISSIIPFSTFLIYILFFVGLLITKIPWQYLVLPLIVKYSLQITMYFISSKKLQIKQIAFFTPFLEIFFLFFNTIIHISALSTKKKQWKY
ncbi:MAG: glycosyltransferase [Bacteroidales bacterium]|jgi:glycosyltransferase involved in cell wall biosynthesis|nr:glycosyltransferase [Bacteroidales bacterium]